MIRRLLLIVLTLLALAGPAGASAPAMAASPGAAPTAATPTVTADAPTGAISALQSTAKSEFPKQIDFDLQAKSNAQIASVRIAYRLGNDPVTSIARVALAPGYRVDAQYHINLAQHYVPPGVTIHYQWQIQDQSGAQLTTDWADLLVADPRFSWHERTLGTVTLHWYSGNDQFADVILAAANKALANASAAQGGTSPDPVNIYFYATEQDFRGAIGEGADPWVGGQTFPLYRLVVLLAPPSDLADDQRSVAHEMTHVAIDSTSEDPFGPLPTWLDEGMAMVAEGSVDAQFQQALSAAAQSHRFLSIQSISGNFPESNDGALLAYAESASLVRYFIQNYGEDRLTVLITAFHQGDSSDAAFQQSIGMNTLAFQRQWEASVLNQASAAAATPTATPRASGPSIARALATPITFLISILDSIVRVVRATKG